MVFGDSISGGSSMNTAGGAGRWFSRAARLLGYSDAWNERLGGTGYITAGSFATLGTRAPIDVIPNSPDVLIISAGYNANGGSLPFISPLTGGIYNAAGTLIATHGARITGTGRVGATTGSGIADTYIGTDAVHPTDCLINTTP